jgi:hypothetical protein
MKDKKRREDIVVSKIYSWGFFHREERPRYDIYNISLIPISIRDRKGENRLAAICFLSKELVLYGSSHDSYIIASIHEPSSTSRKGGDVD